MKGQFKLAVLLTNVRITYKIIKIMDACNIFNSAVYMYTIKSKFKLKIKAHSKMCERINYKHIRQQHALYKNSH